MKIQSLNCEWDMDYCMTELPGLSVKSYAEFLISQGEVVVDLEGVFWMKYHGALISAAAMPVYIDLTYDEGNQLLKKSGALFLRYESGPVKTPTNWWTIVCRHYDFNQVSSNTRSKIRRGTRRLEIKQLSPEWLSEKGYECHVKCYQRYKHAMPKSRKAYISFINSLRGQSVFDIWGCLKNGELQGYIICLVESDGVFMHTIDITPAALHEYATYAMIHRILEYYVNEKGLAVSNGTRSISHETNMQDFLCKLGFEREYAELHVVYRNDIKLVVGLLYPFRNILKLISMIPIIHKVSSVLFQEQIFRNQNLANQFNE